jgi:hypothetical protein
MDAERVGRKAQKILGPGRLCSSEGVTEWFWLRDEDGREIRLGSTLKEAWHNLDKLTNDRQVDRKR